jgi:hypothetical protein
MKKQNKALLDLLEDYKRTNQSLIQDIEELEQIINSQKEYIDKVEIEKKYLIDKLNGKRVFLLLISLIGLTFAFRFIIIGLDGVGTWASLTALIALLSLLIFIALFLGLIQENSFSYLMNNLTKGLNNNNNNITNNDNNQSDINIDKL